MLSNYREQVLTPQSTIYILNNNIKRARLENKTSMATAKKADRNTRLRFGCVLPYGLLSIFSYLWRNGLFNNENAGLT